MAYPPDRFLSRNVVHITPSAMVEAEVGSWRVITDEGFVRKLSGIRTEHLPNETGGILLGAWDLVRHLVYIVDVVPAPSDSMEKSKSFIRGCCGLKKEVETALQRTGGMLQYVGEWHSHPDEYTAAPSNDDYDLFGWISELTTRDGYPPVMLIVGRDGFTWFVEQMPDHEPAIDE